MMNRRQTRAAARRGQPPQVTAEHAGCCGRRPPVESLTEAQLHQELVADAVGGHATDLIRAVAAYERIGKLNRRGAEAAFQAVRDEVAVLRGRAGMPML